MRMTDVFFRRYTSLPFLIDILQGKRLPLLDPATWEDKNDSYYLELFKKAKKLKSVLAICFAEAQETYHHWKIYSGDSSGVCIEFYKDRLLDKIKIEKGYIGKKIRYRAIWQLYETPVIVNDLPFVKRSAFKDEREYRILYCDLNRETKVEYIPITQNDINKIIINPWVHDTVFKSLETVIKSIDQCARINVTKSTVIENRYWKKQGEEAVDEKRTKRVILVPE